MRWVFSHAVAKPSSLKAHSANMNESFLPIHSVFLFGYRRQRSPKLHRPNSTPLPPPLPPKLPQPTLPTPNQRLKPLAYAIFPLPQLPRTFVPVFLSELEFVQDSRDEGAVVFGTPFVVFLGGDLGGTWYGYPCSGLLQRAKIRMGEAKGEGWWVDALAFWCGWCGWI